MLSSACLFIVLTLSKVLCSHACVQICVSCLFPSFNFDSGLIAEVLKKDVTSNETTLSF